MDANLTTAIASTSGSVVVAIVAILANNRGFDDVNRRIGHLGACRNESRDPDR
jgi:hypothetical protein